MRSRETVRYDAERAHRANNASAWLHYVNGVSALIV